MENELLAYFLYIFSCFDICERRIESLNRPFYSLGSNNFIFTIYEFVELILEASNING